MRSAVSRLEEGLEIVRLLWQSDGPVSLAGGHWDVNDAMLGLAAAYERRPPDLGGRPRRSHAVHCRPSR